MHRQRRATFDEVAELFDRARPTYPDELFDDLVELTGLDRRARVLEIGPGTGKATLPLAGRGMRVTGIELGSSLAAVAQRKLALFPGVQIVNADFETWEPPGTDYDAVVAFTAFHWIKPDVRYTKAAAPLREGGALAVVLARHVLTEGADPFFLEAQADYAAVQAGGEPPGPPEAVTERRYQWDVDYTRDAYLDLLATASNHRMLDARTRTQLFDRLRARIGDRTLRSSYLATLDVAVRI
jgi:SAM-dependent methyltransferase